MSYDLLEKLEREIRTQEQIASDKVSANDIKNLMTNTGCTRSQAFKTLGYSRERQTRVSPYLD